MKTTYKPVKLSTMQGLHLEYVKHSTSLDKQLFFSSWFRNLEFSKKQIAIHEEVLRKIHEVVSQEDSNRLREKLQLIFGMAFEKSITLFKEEIFPKKQTSITFNIEMNFKNINEFEKQLREGNGTTSHRILYLSKQFLWAAELDINNLQKLPAAILTNSFLSNKNLTSKEEIQLLPLKNKTPYPFQGSGP